MTGETLATKAAVDPIISKAYLQELAHAFSRRAPIPRCRWYHRCGPTWRVLPPLLVQVGSAETLLDDAVRIAAKAGAADVRVTLEVWPHMIHAWHLWAAKLASGRRALASAGAFIRVRV